jgi:hypothetical protein
VSWKRRAGRSSRHPGEGRDLVVRPVPSSRRTPGSPNVSSDVRPGPDRLHPDPLGLTRGDDPGVRRDDGWVGSAVSSPPSAPFAGITGGQFTHAARADGLRRMRVSRVRRLGDPWSST